MHSIVRLSEVRQVLFDGFLHWSELHLDRRELLADCGKVNALKKRVVFQVLDVLSPKALRWVLNQNLSNEVAGHLRNVRRYHHVALLDKIEGHILVFALERHAASQELKDHDA